MYYYKLFLFHIHRNHHNNLFKLFLKLFHNILCTLKRDPLCGCVSPSLIGTTGVIPLTIISTIPDIMQHHYHCIIHAKKEVLLATNYWEKSESVNVIGKALKELNKRAVKENRYVIVKIMIDHPTKENITHYHSKIPSNKWSDYDIPSPNEIPNLSVEVINYHRMIMGTFHSKFIIIDRRRFIFYRGKKETVPMRSLSFAFIFCLIVVRSRWIDG